MENNKRGDEAPLLKKSNLKLKQTPSTFLSYTFDVLRVVPESTKPTKNLNSDRLTDLLAVLFIFGIALWIRFWFRAEFLTSYPYGTYFNLGIKDGDPLGIGRFFGINPGDTVNTEGYVDFDYYYIDYVNAYADKGWNPYSGNLEDGDVLNAYVYGPWYIYFISIGKMYFDLTATESIIWSNIIFDSLTYVMVYLLAKRITGNVIAMLAAVLGSFSPIALFYANVMVLNAPSMTFLSLVFIYFFLEHKDKTAAFFLAFAILNKQFPLFLAMPFGFWLVRRNGFLKGVVIFLIGFIFAIVLSLPWILMTPESYYIKLFLAGGGKQILNCPSGGEATNLVQGEMNPISCEEDNQVVITEFGRFLFKYINNHWIFFVSLFLLAWVGFTAYDKMEKEPHLYYKFFAAYFALSHATIARGIYKYYLTLMVPIFILALVPGNREYSMNIRLGRMLHNGWSTWIDPKYRNRPASWQYWLFFAVLLTATISIFFLIEFAVSLFTETGGYHDVWTALCCLAAFGFIIKPGGEEIQPRDRLTTSQYNLKIIVFVIITFYLVNLLKPVYSEYFHHDENAITRYSEIFLMIFAIFFIIPYISSTVTKSKNIKSCFTISYSQIILDIVGVILAYRIIILFHKQLFLANRFYTTTVMLAYALFFMVLLGEEVWTTYIRVPRNAINRFFKLWHKIQWEGFVKPIE